MNELKTINNIPKNYSDISGLKIYTNLDYNTQKILEDNIKKLFQMKLTNS